MNIKFFEQYVPAPFTADEIIDVSKYVDDCACGCQQHYTVKDGLIHVHGKPVFDRLLVDGDLGLRGNAELLRLPDELAVSGSVYLSDCINLKIMPSQMYVGGNVFMERTDVRELPQTMVVEGRILAKECHKLVEIPGSLRTTALDATNCSNLERIAPGLEIDALDLSDGPIAELPSNLTIKCELKLRHCSQLAVIPEGVSVAQLIDVTGCSRLFTLPRSVQPRVVITDGMLYATDCMILPTMTEDQANMCLGVKAIDAFPHHHLKNIERMQETVLTLEHKFKGRPSARSFAWLKSKRRSRDAAAFTTLNSRLNADRVVLRLPSPHVKKLT